MTHYENVRVLIWGKTYPELSSKYTETVCTAGVREDGRPIRLFPVPLRYLDTEQQYQLYDWIDVPIQRHASDPRPESFRIRSDGIQKVRHLAPDTSEWAERRALIMKDQLWQFRNLDALKKAQHETQRSLGIIEPGVIEGIRLRTKTKSEREIYYEKMAQIQAQADMFHPQYKELEFLEKEIKLEWRCGDPCSTCVRSPHSMQVLDWGLLELARRNGWDAAEARLAEISDLARYDFRLFMGNFRLHLTNFGIVGLWYPKRRDQLVMI